jgi:hypothetical protein
VIEDCWAKTTIAATQISRDARNIFIGVLSFPLNSVLWNICTKLRSGGYKTPAKFAYSGKTFSHAIRGKPTDGSILKPILAPICRISLVTWRKNPLDALYIDWHSACK